MADIRSFLRWFDSATSSRPDVAANHDPSRTDRRRVALLMAAMASVDGRLAPAERSLLVRVLRDEPDAERLLDEAIEAARDGAGLDETLTLIRHDWPEERRVALLRQAELMAAADGVMHEFEDGMLARLARLLGLEARAP